MGAAVRRVYDQRLPELVYEFGSLQLAASAGVCRPTAKSWLRLGLREVVTVDLVAKDEAQLRSDVIRPERRVEVLVTIIYLLVLPEDQDKERILNTILASERKRRRRLSRELHRRRDLVERVAPQHWAPSCRVRVSRALTFPGKSPSS